MKKQKPTPPKPVAKRGLDYTPQRPHSPALSYGIAERIKASYTNTAHEIVARRLENFEAAGLPALEGVPTCPRHDILLPWHAPDHCATYRGICDHFEAQALPHQQHLIGILTRVSNITIAATGSGNAGAPFLWTGSLPLAICQSYLPCTYPLVLCGQLVLICMR